MNTRRAFTVPELLTVVAIIMIIISILLPSMGKARAHARMSICLSNQHQLALAWRSYGLDNQQRLMGAHTARPKHDWVVNYDAPSVPTNETVDAIKRGAMWPYVNNLLLYKCPDDPRKDY